MMARVYRFAILVAALASASIGVVTAFFQPSPTTTVHHWHYLQQSTVTLTKCNYSVSPNNEDNTTSNENSSAVSNVDIPSFIISPVLAKVYPAMIAHKEKYGNVNIPLGNTDGKRCKTLRRLHFQNKLTDEETEHLTELGFRFHSFEDVYYENDFDEMLDKLIEYHDEFKTYQIPKKYELDPELGAWVTMLRRLYKIDHLPQIQVDKLDALKFEWESTRKCGSAFMKKYREVLSYLNKVVEAGGDVSALVHEDADVMKWIDSQRIAYENGKLSDSRIKYMDDLPGIDWRIPIVWA